MRVRGFRQYYFSYFTDVRKWIYMYFYLVNTLFVSIVSYNVESLLLHFPPFLKSLINNTPQMCQQLRRRRLVIIQFVYLA